MAFEDVLPKSILARNKQGFDMPIGEWFRQELQDDLLDTICSVNMGIVDNTVIKDLLSDHVNNRNDHWKFLWSVYVFKSWLSRMRHNGLIDSNGNAVPQ